MNDKPLMKLSEDNVRSFDGQPETGMGFYIAEGQWGLLAVLLDGLALPLYKDSQYYCLNDLLKGQPLPAKEYSKEVERFPIGPSFDGRFDALAAMQNASISQKYTGQVGALPLIASLPLTADTTFFRYLSAAHDRRFDGSRLAIGTYLTSEVDRKHADSGFGAVGRYALPIPLPASYVVQYELPAGTNIQVGTAAPSFGQAGGGVEIRLTAATPVSSHSHFMHLPDF